MKLSLCVCVCVILVGLVKSSPMVTRSNYRNAKRGNSQPFTPPPCNNETTLICRHMPKGDFEACMNPRAAQEQIRLGHADAGECPDPCADCGNNQTTLSLGDLVDVNLAEPGNRRKRNNHLAAGDSLVSDGNGMFILESHKVTICHNPEGPSPQTIVVSAQSLQNHLAHGDTEGVCPDCFCSLDELEDVSIVNATDCHVVHFTEEGGWENKNIREIVNNTLADLDDTTIVDPEDCNVIHYQDGTWENKDIREIVNNTVVDLDDTCAENPQAGDHLVFNGTCYKNTNECPSGCGNQDACPSGCDLSICPASCDDVCPSACSDGGSSVRVEVSKTEDALQPLEPGSGFQVLAICPAGTRPVSGSCSNALNKKGVAMLWFGIRTNPADAGWLCVFINNRVDCPCIPNCLNSDDCGAVAGLRIRATVVCETGALP